MAVRFLYKPKTTKPYVECVPVEFKWESGMALAQRVRSSRNLHKEVQDKGLATKLLEISRVGKTQAGGISFCI